MYKGQGQTDAHMGPYQDIAASTPSNYVDPDQVREAIMWNPEANETDQELRTYWCCSCCSSWGWLTSCWSATRGLEEWINTSGLLIVLGTILMAIGTIVSGISVPMTIAGMSLFDLNGVLTILNTVLNPKTNRFDVVRECIGLLGFAGLMVSSVWITGLLGVVIKVFSLCGIASNSIWAIVDSIMNKAPRHGTVQAAILVGVETFSIANIPELQTDVGLEGVSLLGLIIFFLVGCYFLYCKIRGIDAVESVSTRTCGASPDDDDYSRQGERRPLFTNDETDRG